jgi:hypothetical protein
LSDQVNGQRPEPQVELVYVTDPEAKVGFAPRTSPIAVIRVDGQPAAVFGMATIAPQFVMGPDALNALAILLSALRMPKGVAGRKRAQSEAIRMAVEVLSRFEMMRAQPLPKLIVKEEKKLIVPGG